MMLLSIAELIPEGFIYLEYRYNLLTASIILVLTIVVGNFYPKLSIRK